MWFLRTVLFLAIVGIATSHNHAQRRSSTNVELNRLFKEFSEAFAQDPQKAKTIVLGMIELAKKIRDTTELAIAYSNLGACEQRLSNFKESEQAYQEFKKLQPHSKIDSIALGRIYNDIGALYLRFNDNVQGLENLLLAYKIRLSIRDEKIGSTLNNIAYTYTRLNDYETAIKYLQESLELRRKQKDTLGTIYVLNNLGGAYGSQGKYPEALTQFEEVLRMATPLNNQSMIASSYGNIGDVYINLAQYEKAIPYLEKQLTITTQLGDKYMICNALINLGKSYTYLKRFGLAENYFQQALELSKELGTSDNITQSYKYLSEMSEERGDYQAALEYSKLYRAISDSIFSADNKAKMDELRVQLDAYKIEQDNILLQKENELQNIQLGNYQTQRILWGSLVAMLLILALFFIVLYQYRTRTNRQLRAINTTKDRLFALVAHDLKNPLSAFKSITQSLNENIDSIEKEEIGYFLKKLYNSSDKLYLLLQNLLEWALNETGKIPYNPTTIGVRESIEEVDQFLLLSAEEKKIVLVNEVPADMVVYGDDKMFKTIVRNLMANAIKFSPKGEKIWIRATYKDTFAVISIEDHGIGISEDDQKKLFSHNANISQIGTSKEKGTGLGLVLCKELVVRQGGQISVESRLQQGSIFSFSIPKQQK